MIFVPTMFCEFEKRISQQQNIVYDLIDFVFNKSENALYFKLPGSPVFSDLIRPGIGSRGRVSEI